MSDLAFRGTDPYEIEKPLRRLIRERIDSTGRVFTDIDLHARHYTKTNKTGVFRMIETKHLNADLTYGQKLGFEQLHRLLRSADPDRNEYIGFYLVRSDDPEWGDDATVKVKRLFENEDEKTFDLIEFIKWLDKP